MFKKFILYLIIETKHTTMKRTKPTKREIARQLIAQHNKEQDAAVLQEKMKAAQVAATYHRIGPKEPVFLPYKENNECY